MTEREIFTAALAQGDPAQRAAYLDEACRGDDALRRRIESLLADHAQLGSFMEVRSPEATLDPAPSELPGAQIGSYKLLQQIGEGGMGVVYMAEQTEPIARRVALKIIKPGMDTRQVIARFEAERQALSLMDHPNIAKVLDAGTTESGRPYFVMELVKGQPITQYCDEKQLTPRERLELLLPVCQAIQHAHQKGIIHRDIKPTNILVAEYDEKPVPKVIDFGVAKAIGTPLTEKTMFTGFGQLVGTLEYMSPEQAKINQLDIDTRSDIYSLGVLLYELLTGSTPFDKHRLRSAAWDEMLRIIREEEPEKPSTRLSESRSRLPDGTSASGSSGESGSARQAEPTLASIAAVRGTEPAKLTKLLRGELDWIVMKALEKDRNRRYETANGLAMDLQRYLADDPVQACPPSPAYRFGKFARRNKATLAFTGLVLFFIVLIGGGAGWAMRDRTAREEQLAQERTARQAKVSGQLQMILDEVARLEQLEKWSDALVAARRAEAALATGEASADVEERARQTLVDLELVRQLDEVRAQSGTVWGGLPQDLPAIALASRVAQADQKYSAALRQAGIDIDALTVKEAVGRITARGPIAAALMPALDDWVAVRSSGKDEGAARRLIDVLRGADPDPWRQQVRDALSRKDWPGLKNLATSSELDRQPAVTLCFLYSALRANHTLYQEGETVLRRAQGKYPADYWINLRLGTDLIFRRPRPPGYVLEGIGFVRAAIALRPDNPHAIMNLGNGYSALGQDDQAIACFQKALELAPNYSASYSNLGRALHRRGRYEEAIVAFEQAVQSEPDRASAYTSLSMELSDCPDARLRNPGRAVELANKAIELDPQFSNPWIALGIARYREGRWQEARDAFDQSLKLGVAFPRWNRMEEANDWFFLAMSNWHLGNKHEALKHWVQAVQWMDKHGPEMQQEKHYYTDLYDLRAEAEGLLGEFPNGENAYRELLRLEPKFAWANYKLADSLFRSGAWAESADAYRKALEEQDPSDLDTWLRCACTLVQAGETEAYHQLCERMVKRLGQSVDVHDIAILAHICVLAPNALTDSARVLQLAEQRSSWTAEVEVHRPWSPHVLGLAYYRNGQYEKAVAQLEASRDNPATPRELKLSNRLALLMARYQLGHRDEAAAALDSAKAAQFEPGHGSVMGLIERILLREAETLLNKQ